MLLLASKLSLRYPIFWIKAASSDKLSSGMDAAPSILWLTMGNKMYKDNAQGNTWFYISWQGNNGLEINVERTRDCVLHYCFAAFCIIFDNLNVTYWMNGANEWVHLELGFGLWVACCWRTVCMQLAIVLSFMPTLCTYYYLWSSLFSTPI